MINAAKTNNIIELKRLLATGININFIDSTGKTALIWAALEARIAVAQYLVKAGADLEAKDRYGETALIWAAENGHLEVVHYLVAAGADLNAKDNDNKTALTWSALKAHVAVAQCLVGAGADLEAKDRYGETALIWAAQNGHLEVVQYLVAAGADLNAKDNDGKTALISASSWGRLEVVQYLVEDSADMEVKANNGNTALMWAAQKGYVAVVQYLIYSGRSWSSSMQKMPNDDAAIAELDQYSSSIMATVYAYAADQIEVRELFTSIRDNIASLRAIQLAGYSSILGGAPYPRRIKLLKARICGVFFPEDFTQNFSGMPLLKFNRIVALMRAAKLAKLVHGVNAYFFTRIVMLESPTIPMLEKMPFDLKDNLLGFVLGKEESSILMRELQSISALAIAPASGSSASGVLHSRGIALQADEDASFAKRL